LVAGKNRVPSPATGNTAFLILFVLLKELPRQVVNPRPIVKQKVKI
jgi:hypothetical protein